MKIQFFDKLLVDIHEYPKQIFSLLDDAELTLGDLHANAILLLYELIKTGIIKLSEANYKKLVAIYTSPELNNKQLQQFISIVDKMKIKKSTFLRLLGDELADRGQNDVFVLAILYKLQLLKLPFEVLLSNHGVEFVRCFMKGNRLVDPRDQFASMARLQDLLDNNEINFNQTQLDKIVRKGYFPNLKLLSYSLSDASDEITIYTHAGVGIETVKHLADRFGLLFNDATASDLAVSIDKINQRFSEYCMNSNKIERAFEDLTSAYPISEEDPVTFMLWNRDYSGLDRNANHKGYKINYVHGHDSDDPGNDNNIYNLDGLLGKAYLHKGKLKLLLSSGVAPRADLTNKQKSASISESGIFRPYR